MENQNIQWANWEEQPQENSNQPQVNWGEQSPEENIPTWGEQPQQGWGEQPQQEQPQQGWGEQPQQEQPQQGWGEQPQQEQPQQGWGEQPLTQESLPSLEDISLNIHPAPRNWARLGKFSRISVDTEVFQLNSNLDKALEDLNQLELTPLGNDGRYDFSPKENTELGNIIGSLVEISAMQNLKINNCYIYKNLPSEASLNIFKGKPQKHFIFFLKGNYNSGDVVLDLSPIGGPSVKAIDASSNILTFIPGWVPFSISRNMSDEEFIAIIGTLD
jgi:hypothetical protein